jgi:hypothetical protein
MLEELTRAFESPDRMRAAGYRIVSEFFDRHGWHLIVREIHGFWTAKPRFRSGQTTMRTSRTGPGIRNQCNEIKNTTEANKETAQ